MSTEPEKTNAASPVKAIQEAIRAGMYNSDDPSDASKVFICEHNLELAWRGHDLKNIFPSTKFDNEDRKVIRESFIRVLSILLLIGWSIKDLKNKFRPLFLRAGREDNKFPLPEEQLSFLDTSSFIFWQQQFAFYPAIIQESETSYIQEIEKNRRLPFSGKPVEVGHGGYGRVSRESIAPRCLQNRGKHTENFEVVDCPYSIDIRAALTNLTAAARRLQGLRE